MSTICIVDDEANMRLVLKMLLEEAGFTAETFADARLVLSSLDGGKRFDCIVSDLRMPGMDGIELLREIRSRSILTPFVIITAYGTIEGAVAAMRLGAADFLTKPFRKDAVLEIVRTVTETGGPLPSRPQSSAPVIYESAEMKTVMDFVAKVAELDVAVLILGESGTGKERIAAAVSEAASRNARSPRPFVAVNCPSLPVTLAESELFGYRKGAFTGADVHFEGKIGAAEGGTLFLDEVADLPPEVQAKLLRFLEEKRYTELGSTKEIRANVRILCATNRDLKKLCAEGKFREDLYYRISTFIIRVPPLRDRRDDILPLARYFIRILPGSRKGMELSPEAETALRSYRWPGNVRELKSVIQRAIILADGGAVGREHLQFDEPSDGPRDDCDGFLERQEQEILRRSLERNGGNITRAAKELGLSRSTLRYRLDKYGIEATAPAPED